MKKKILALALALVMLTGVVPLSASAANITENDVTNKLNNLMSGTYKTGTQYTGSGECFGFAVAVFNSVFGTSLSAKGYSNAYFSYDTSAYLTEVGHLTNFTQTQLANLLKNARRGDMLLLADSGKAYGHVMIIWSVSSSGVPTVYDANASTQNKKYGFSKNAIGLHEYTLGTAIYHNGAATLYRYKDYQDGSTTSTSTSATAPAVSVTEGGVFFVSPKCAPNSCLEVQGGNTANGANVQIGTLNKSATYQQWKFVSVGSGYYKLVPQHSNRALDVKSQGTTSGTNVQQYDFSNNHDSQRWKLEDAGGGYYYIIPKGNTSLCLDVFGGGTNVQIFTRKQGDNQKWKLIPVTASCTTHTKGAYQFYEKLHPHYNYWKCSVCGENFTDKSTETMASCKICNPPAPNCDNGHTWGSWETVKEATCEEDGKRERTCSVCGTTTSEPLSALGHDYQVSKETDTYTRYTCSNCGDSYREDKEADCSNGHSWSKWNGYEATCGSDGWKWRYCTVCGEEEEVETPATGKHNYVYDDETTYFTYYVCQNCGDYKSEEKPSEVVDNSGMTNFTTRNYYYSGLFSDVKSGDWFSGNVETAYSLGLMNGTGSGVFSPGNNMTIAEVVTLAARVHKLYYTGSDSFTSYDGGNWYDPYVNYARDNGIISENYNFTRPATREQVVHILAQALPEDELASSVGRVSFADSGDITYMADVNLLSRAGVVNGIKESSSIYFKPLAPITRAEVAAIVGRMVQPSTRVK